MKSHLSYFGSSYGFTAFALIAAFFLGGFPALITVGFLAVLETSLSFDNAVVNASVLKNWDEVWRRRFLTYGMIIAVFGMRLLFPILIVAVVANMSLFSAFGMAISTPLQYSAILTGAHHLIVGFGGSFLLMVFLKYFLDAEKEEHWLGWLEKPLSKLGNFDGYQVMIALGAIVATSFIVPMAQQVAFLFAGIAGIATYVVTHSLANFFGAEDGEVDATLVKQGIMGFLYLEILDASFSFDGVIGAFALTSNIWLIALGLGVGAMFVRSFTILLVEKDTLDTLKYLEHGAFWAIGALAAMMFTGLVYHIPEYVIGLVGALFIGSAAYHSHVISKSETT